MLDGESSWVDLIELTLSSTVQFRIKMAMTHRLRPVWMYSDLEFGIGLVPAPIHIFGRLHYSVPGNPLNTEIRIARPPPPIRPSGPAAALPAEQTRRRRPHGFDGGAQVSALRPSSLSPLFPHGSLPGPGGSPASLPLARNISRMRFHLPVQSSSSGNSAAPWQDPPSPPFSPTPVQWSIHRNPKSP